MSVSSALLTGGAGFVGAAVVQALSARHPHCRIFILDRRIPAESDRIPDVKYYAADVTKPAEVSRLMQWLRPQVVVHSAGIVPPVPQRYSRTDDARVFKVNVEGTRVVLEAAKEAGVQAFVLTSSCTVVTDALDHELPNVDETLPCFARSLTYGESKAESERIALAASDESMPVCAIRPSVTFGPGDPNCFPTVYACIGRHETPFVIGSGDNLYDFTYVDNIAYAHVLAAENLLTSRTAAGEAFFISNGEPIPFRDFCLAIWAGLGHRPPFEIHIPANVAWAVGYALEWAAWLTGQPIGYCRGSVYDALRTRYLRIDKARKVLGYSPLVSVADGLRLTCQAQRKEIEARRAVKAQTERHSWASFSISSATSFAAKESRQGRLLRGLLTRGAALLGIGHRLSDYNPGL